MSRDATTLQQRLVYAGIQAINDCVTRLPMDEAHAAINQLRDHLESRAEQTQPERKAPKGKRK